MRCNNCGWLNKATNLKCEKCNYPLDGSLNVNDLSNEGSLPPNPSNDLTNKLNKTISGRRSIMDPWDAPNAGEVVRGDFPENLDPSSPSEDPKVNIGPTLPNLDVAQSDSNDSDFQKRINQTFDPSQLAGTGKTLKLDLIAKEGEEGNKELSFSGKQIELNRENVDPENYSITSHIQAEIVYENGKWYLVDKSELKTTFIQVNEPVELKEGDIILLGNRKLIVRG